VEPWQPGKFLFEPHSLTCKMGLVLLHHLQEFPRFRDGRICVAVSPLHHQVALQGLLTTSKNVVSPELCRDLPAGVILRPPANDSASGDDL
jgi:hypothetical protein